MSTNRIHHLGAAGLVVATSLLIVLAAHVGWTAAATGTSGASASGALQGHVSIHVKGRRLGAGKGDQRRFTISGAISDRGGGSLTEGLLTAVALSPFVPCSARREPSGSKSAN
jgi:hypothetical protein